MHNLVGHLFYVDYVSYIALKSIFIYYSNYNIDFGNGLSLYFNNHLIYITGCIVFMLVISLFFKKEKINIMKDNSKLIFIVIALISFFPFLADTMSIKVAISCAVGIFSFIMIFKINSLNTKSESQKIYFSLGALMLYTSNILGFILIVLLYFQLDKNGLNV